MADAPVVVITGANGFIGTHLVGRFRSAGWMVRALVHHPPKAAIPGVAYKEWGLSQELGSSTLAGADCVVHAAFVKYENPNASELNIAGSKRLAAECRAAGLSRIVFLSSMSARPGALSQYGRDKFDLQSEFGSARELVVRPGLVLGNGGLFHSMRRVVERGRIVPLAGGGQQLIQTIHIDDLAEAILSGIRLGLSGIVTVAEPHPIRFKDLLVETAHLLRVRALFLPVPYEAVDLAMRTAALMRIRLPVSLDNLLGLKGLQTQDVSEDLDKLGVHVRPYRDSLASIIGDKAQSLSQSR